MSHLRAQLLLALLLTACRSGTAELGGDKGGNGDDTAGGDTDDTAGGDRDDTAGGGDDTGSVEAGAITVSPPTIDFGLVFVGQAVEETVTVSNVGGGAVEVSLALSGGGASSYTINPATADPAPGASSEHTLTFAPGAWGDLSTDLVITESLGGDEVVVPVAATVQIDLDGDGHGSPETGGDDCDDTDATIHPGAPETWYDGIDSDCGGDDDYDQDQDGHQSDAWGGDDCDDTDASVYTGADDAWYDGVDSDCGGEDDYDQDGDGYRSDAWGGDDCDDTEPGVNPGARETWYDGLDADCAGDDDYDQDKDGHQSQDWGGDDCDDTDAAVTGPEDETLNWSDDDCDGSVDELDVADAASGVLYGTQRSMNLGDRGTLGIMGDLTGNGKADLVAVTDGYGNGYVWVVDGAAAAAAAGMITSYDTAQISCASSNYYLNWVVGPAEDQDGDGIADLLLGGWYDSTYYRYGAVWLFDGGSGLSGSMDTGDRQASFTGDDSSDELRLAALGDVDGDGLADVVTGAPYDNYGSYSSGTDSGNVAFFLGGGLSGSYDIDDVDDEIHGQSSHDYLGAALVLADLDDDGYADVIAGAPGDDDTASGAGAVYVFEGNASAAWSAQADGAASVKIIGPSSSDAIGEDTLPHPGDVDGDGKLDLAVPSEDEGKLWLFLDAANLTASVSASSADHIFSGVPGDYASAVAVDSDLDGDRADEVVIGGDSANTSASDSGVFYVYRYLSGWGAALGATDADATIWGSDANDYLGIGMAGGADLDGDGREDLVVGAVGVDDGASDGGAVYVILGW